MTTAGKTGTVTQRKGMTFAGITPYYTSAVWVGHDDYKELASGDAGRWAAPLWKAYMTKVVEGLPDKDILPGTAADYGVTRYSVCSVSGKKAVSGCPTTSDYFAVGTMPTESCDVHVTANICTESNELASNIARQSWCIGGGCLLPGGSALPQALCQYVAYHLPQPVYGRPGDMPYPYGRMGGKSAKI